MEVISELFTCDCLEGYIRDDISGECGEQVEDEIFSDRDIPGPDNPSKSDLIYSVIRTLTTPNH